MTMSVVSRYTALATVLLCLCTARVAFVAASVDAEGLADFCGDCSGQDPNTSACDSIPDVCAPVQPDDDASGDSARLLASSDEFRPTFCGSCAPQHGSNSVANPAACKAAINTVCACDKGDVATAKAAMDNCLDSDPYTDPYTDAYTDGPADVCSCLQYFEAYEAALETCGEDPSAAYEDTFEGACDDNDNDDDGGNNEQCDGFLVEGLALAAWQCMGTKVACACKDQVTAYNNALVACGDDKDETLVKLVMASCGTATPSPAVGRAKLCEGCDTVDALDSDDKCKGFAEAFCDANPTTWFCRACEPASEHCSAAFDSTCGSCGWGAWSDKWAGFTTCLTTNRPCMCQTQYRGVVAATSGDDNDGCPDVPDYVEDRMDACVARGDDACDKAAVSATFNALKTCQTNNAICDCVTAFSDYAGATKACGLGTTSAVRDAFATCDAEGKCAGDVASAFNKLVDCAAVQEDHCACRHAYNEWSDLVTSCGTGADASVTSRYTNCQQSDTSRPSTVELTADAFTADAADGYAAVTLRRFGGAGDKAGSSAEVTLAAYLSGGRYTGTTVEVEWDADDMGTKTAQFKLSSGALEGVTSFRVAIVEASDVVVGSVSRAAVTVTPVPVTPTISIKYPAAGVVWHQSTTKRVEYSTVGFPEGATFSVNLQLSGAQALHVGTGAGKASLSVTVPADATISDAYTVVVSLVTAGTPVVATSAAFSIAAATGGVAPTVAVSLTGAAPYVAWLGEDLSFTLTATSPSPSDDKVVVVAVDGSGSVVGVAGRWDVDDIDSGLEWEVPRDLPVADTPTYMLQAYLLVAGDYYVDSTTAFAAQPPVEFKTGSWSACSEACGAGTQTRSVMCVRVDDGSNDEEDTRDCQRYFDLPEASKACFQKPCAAYGWLEGEWSECSVSCGSGTQSRTVACVDDTSSPVLSSQCTVAIAGKMPPTTRACPGLPSCETYEWRKSKWLQCSEECGDGHQLRVVACIGSRGTVSPDGSLCDADDKPEGRQPCNEEACDEFEWEPARWSSCSAVCGGGTQTRTVTCEDSSTGATAAGQCDEDDKPKTSRNCNKFKCPNQEVKWSYGDWGACSVTCGGGTKTRTATCVGATGAEVPDSNCNDADLTARTSVACGMAPCNPCAEMTCANGGTCTDGVCACASDFKGALCLTPSSCAGLLDGAGSCCDSGVVAKSGACCTASGAVAPVVDGTGECCASGVVDKCRVCDGTGVGYDQRGQCCSGADAVLDGAHRCCTSDELDACGVCFGDGRSCNLKLQLRMKKPSKYDVADLLVEGSYAQLMYLQDEYPALMAALLGIPSSRIVGLGVSAVASGRRLINDDALMELHPSVARVLVGAVTQIQVQTQIVAEATSTVSVDDVVDSLYSAAAGGTSDVAAVDSYSTESVCGNQVCEEGETCASADDKTCCSADCPFQLQACPVPAGSNDQCGQGGTCNTATGACTCYSDLGYTGTDCGECAYPYMSDGSGGCFNAQPAALSGTTGGSTTGGSTTGGSTTGGSTTGGSTTGGSGTGGGGGMPGWAIPAIIGGAVVVLVAAGVVYKFGCSGSRPDRPHLKRRRSLLDAEREMTKLHGATHDQASHANMSKV